MPDLTSQKAVQAIARQVADVIGSQLDGVFSVIRYPSGFNYAVQYGQPPYFNPNTFKLIDQLCAVDDTGVVTLTGSSFSALYANVLRNVVFVQSSADAKTLKALLRDFGKQSNKLVTEFEKNFGKITDAQIAASGCKPPTKIGYVEDYVTKNYDGNPADMGPSLTTFATLYSDWLATSRKVAKLSAVRPDAQQDVATALENTTDPTAANGGVQTSASDWSVAYDGLPDNNQIAAGLQSKDRNLTVEVTLKSQPGGDLAMLLDRQALGTLAKSAFQVSFHDPASSARRQSLDLWEDADQIDMSIAYSGITILSAQPAEISASLKTGWFSTAILQQIVTKTGKDVSGLQLSGSTYSVADLFGQGKTFARVKTFVISREPTITLQITGAIQAAAVKTGDPARIALNGIFDLGQSDGGLLVSEITFDAKTTTIVLAPPEQVGTTPPIDLTTHIIGGVIDYPPVT